MRSGSIAVFLGVMLLACQVSAEEQITLKSKKDKTSYAIGLDLAKNLKRESIELDPDILLKGVKDGLSGAKSLMPEEEIQGILSALRQELIEKQAQEVKKLAGKNKKEGEIFLEENKKKEGVKILPSGLQYRVIAEGAGRSPKETDTVTVNYRGSLIDGTEFDSSYKRGSPASFRVNGIIRGWTEALQLMKEGAKWQLFIPPDLAYGERGAGNVIGPDATLIFEVELISIK